jgi:O-acetyl-ADP-ribose deacetylase (regulator of RNase III)
MLKRLLDFVRPKVKKQDFFPAPDIGCFNTIQSVASMMKDYSHVALRIEVGSITKVSADAIVNSTNRLLIAGGGLDWAIHSAAGPGLQKELAPHGQCDDGQVVVTGGHNLSCSNIIHTVTPVWVEDASSSFEKLRKCYQNIFKAAHELGCRSVAIPAIGTGVHETPIAISAQIAKEEYRDFFSGYEGSISEIIFVLHTPSDFNIYRESLECFDLLPRKVDFLTSVSKKFDCSNIILHGDFVVHVEPSSTNVARAFLYGPDTELLDIGIENDRLIIESRASKPIALSLMVHHLESIKFVGSGEINIHGAYGELSVVIDGAINLVSDAEIGRLQLDLEGAGNADLGVEVRALSLVHEGEFDVTATITEVLRVSKNGMGDVDISGAPATVEIKDNGIGKITY